MKRKVALLLLLPIQLLVLKVLSFFPETVERYYSNGVYPAWSKALRWTLGNFTFSVGDVVYLIVITLVVRWLWLQCNSWKTQWKENVLNITLYIAVFYMIFTLSWGLNYLRVPLHEKLHIEKEYTQAELKKLTLALIAKTNSMHAKLVTHDSMKVQLPFAKEEIFNKTILGYKKLEKHYPYLKYQTPSVKASLISLPLTYMGFGGYLNPFTHEAQVNYKIPKHNFVVTTAHEMSHQIGIGSESEANFVGYMATIYNTDPYIQYCGYAYALRYCLRNLEAFEPGITENLLPTLHSGIVKDYQETQTFWDQHQSFIDVIFHTFYDNFLKVNQQTDGMVSYSKFVDLLVNYYKSRPL